MPDDVEAEAKMKSDEVGDRKDTDERSSDPDEEASSDQEKLDEAGKESFPASDPPAF
jgi:hypothetical protein